MESQPPQVMPLWRFSRRTYGDAVFGEGETEDHSTRIAWLYGGKLRFTSRIYSLFEVPDGEKSRRFPAVGTPCAKDAALSRWLTDSYPDRQYAVKDR